MAVFYPRLAYISGITNASQAVITFTEDHTFTEGEIVSFRVGRPFGMREINEQRGKVLSLTDDTITVDIDSTLWTAFDYSVLDDPGTSPPCCVPSSSGVVPNSDLEQTNILDSFDHRPS